MQIKATAGPKHEEKDALGKLISYCLC